MFRNLNEEGLTTLISTTRTSCNGLSWIVSYNQINVFYSENLENFLFFTVLKIPSKRTTDEPPEEGRNKKAQKVQHNVDKVTSLRFEHLPQEIQSNIFKRLGCDDLKCASIVCQQWSAVISSNMEATENIWFRYPQGIEATCSRKYVNIKFDEIPPIADLLETLGDKRQFVRKIQIEIFDKTANDIRNLLEMFPLLGSIQLSEADFNLEQSDEQDFMPMSLNSVKDLTIFANTAAFARVSIAAAGNSKLTSLKLHMSSSQHSQDEPAIQSERLSEELLELLISNHQLKTLDLKSVSSAARQRPLISGLTRRMNLRFNQEIVTQLGSNDDIE